MFYEVTAEHQAVDLHGREHGPLDTLYLGNKTQIGVTALGDDFPLDGWCLAVRSLDAAGNASAPAMSCDACLWKEHNAGEIFGPDWAPVPGGACDAMQDSTATSEPTTGSNTDDSTAADPPRDSSSTGDPATAGEDPLVPHGCGCKQGVSTDPGWLLVLLIFRRRRPGCFEGRERSPRRVTRRE